MRDETYLQERYICLDCSVRGILKLNIEETRYMPNPCELNSRNTDGQISQAKERKKKKLEFTEALCPVRLTYYQCRQLSEICRNSRVDIVEHPPNSQEQQHLSTLAVVCDKAIQDQIA